MADAPDSAEYGERWADVYDQVFPSFADQDDCISLLAEMAAGGKALELAIGTGRIALPLAARGVDVEGVDISPAMVAKLRAKPGGDGIKVTIGDFADVPVEGRFRLIYITFNTLFALLAQEQQLRCFSSVAGHLEPGGAFVTECFFPNPRLLARGNWTDTIEAGGPKLRLTFSRADVSAQRIDSSYVELTDAGARLLPIHIRYAWPAELDLMARLAGMRLQDRWGGWARQPFTSTSAKHVSVYRAGALREDQA